MLAQVEIYSIAVWLVTGAFCGWLESLRSEAGHTRLVPNMLVCVIGAVAAGLVFKWAGELGPPWQGPIYSGFIGAAIAVVLLSPLLQRIHSVRK